MKKAVLIPIIIGSVLVTAATIALAIGIANSVNVKKEIKTYELNDKSFTNFNIDLDTTDLEFAVSSEGEKKVVVEDTKNNVHTVDVVDNTLSIIANKKRNVFNFGIVNCKATIYLPVDAYNSLIIKNDTGDIKIPHDFTFTTANIDLSTGKVDFKAEVKETLKARASTGDITISDTSVQTLDVETSTGKQNYSNLYAAGEIKLKASTGDIALDNVRGQKFSSEVSTGKTKLKNTVIAEDIKIRANTGDVAFDASDAATLDIETSTGDVEGTLLTSKIFYVETSTGKINVPVSTEGGLCKVKTSTGDVTFRIVE